MSFIDWNAAALPAQIAGQQTANQSAQLDLVQKNRALNALRGVKLDDQGSVGNALNGLIQLGMVDQAKGLTDLAQTRGVNTSVLPVVQGALADAANDQQPPPIDAAHRQILQRGADATSDLMSIKDPAERATAAAAYKAQFMRGHVPEQNIDEVFGDLSDQGLQAHHDFLSAAAQGQDAEHPTNYAASRSVFDANNPGGDGARQVLQGHLMNPIVQAALAKAGLNVEPGIGQAIAITGPARSAAASAPYSPVTVEGPQGQPEAMSAANFAAGQASPGAQPIVGPTPGQVTQQNAAATAPYQPVHVPGPQGQDVVESAAQFAGGGGPIQGPTPAASATFAASGNQLSEDRASAANSMTQATALRKVYDLLPTTNTGPGTQATNTWRSFLHSQAPILDKLIPGFDQRTIDTANTDELRKYMVQIAGNAAAQYGQGTNEKLAVAASGNPNPDVSNLAARDVTRMAIALQRAQTAKPALFQTTGQDPSQYGAWAANYGRTVDPRAFMLDILSPTERAKMLKTITTVADKKRFAQGVLAAEAAGVFTRADIPR